MEKPTTIKDVKLIEFNQIKENNGTLVPIEDFELPFEIKRTFYVYKVDSNDLRGQHAHKQGEQVLICLGGTLVCMVDDGVDRKHFVLDSPTQGLYIPKMIWDEQIYISKDTLMLSLANNNYDSEDYILNYKEFRQLKTENNENG